MKLTKEQYADYQLSLQGARNDAPGIALTPYAVETPSLDNIAEVSALQGEAQAYRRLLKALKEPRRASTPEV